MPAKLQTPGFGERAEGGGHLRGAGPGRAETGSMFEARRRALPRSAVPGGGGSSRRPRRCRMAGGLGRRPLFRRLAHEGVCRGFTARDGGDTFGEAFAADSGHRDIAVGPDPRRGPGSGPGYRYPGTKVIGLLGPALDAEVRCAALGGHGASPSAASREASPRRRPRFPAGCLLPGRSDVGGRGLDRSGRSSVIRAAPRRRPRGAELTPNPSGRCWPGHSSGRRPILPPRRRTRGRCDDAAARRQVRGQPARLPDREKARTRGALTIGLVVLATLADLCRTAEASVLVPASPRGRAYCPSA